MQFLPLNWRALPNGLAGGSVRGGTTSPEIDAGRENAVGASLATCFNVQRSGPRKAVRSSRTLFWYGTTGVVVVWGFV